jgi:predicted permease
MSIQSRFSFLWSNLFRKEQRDRELDAELCAYVDMLAEEKQKQGIDAAEARRQALIEAGGIAPLAEEVRDIRTGALLESIAQDIRYGFRTFARNPGFTIAAVLALALGIGANAAIFSVVNAVLLRPLPYKDPSRLVVILRNNSSPIAPANYLDWRAQSQSFTDIAAAEMWSPNLADERQPEKLTALRVTPNIFALLGVEPILGRVVSQQSPDARELVLSYALWQRRFGGDSGVLGREIRLNGEPFTIVGVMPRDFKFAPFWATRTEAWAPLDLAPRATSRTGSSLRLFARLKPGVSLRQAQAEISTITARLEQQFPGTNRDTTVTALNEKVVGDIRPALLVLLGAVGFVLLIACANVAHMLLARAAARRKETAIRTAVGARRSRLVRQFLTESTVLSLLGGAVGLLLASWGIRVLVAMSPRSIPRLETVSLDSHVLLFVLGISILTGLLFGIVPALQASIINPSESLKEGGRNSAGAASHGRLRNVMVASEFAMALVLLVGAGLMIRSLIAIYKVDPGFDSHNVITMQVSVSGSAAGQPERRAAFYQQVVDGVRSLPGVQSASAINHIPLAGDDWGFPFLVEGRPVPPPAEIPGATYRAVLPGYFATMQIPLLRGRDFNATDDARATRAVVINEEFARQYWPNDDPVGKRIAFDDQLKADTEWWIVVGVSKNVKRTAWVAAEEPEAYVPLLQSPQYLATQSPAFAYITLVARTTGDPASLVNSIKNQIWSLDNTVPISAVQTIDQIVEDATAQPRFYMTLLAAFAAVALLLAAIGIYGVMSYAVSLRTHELGVRIALGASRRDLLRLIVGQGMTLVLVGGAIGLTAALLLTRLMASLLYGVRATDLATFVAVSLLLGVVAFVACYAPASRAARIDPMSALRSE